MYKQIFEKFSFFLQYGDPKTVRAVLGFSAGSYDFGERPFLSADQAGPHAGGLGSYGYPPPAGCYGRFGVVGGNQIQLGIDNAFLEFVVPNTPVKVGVGLMGFGIGGRLFMGKNIPGATVTVDLAPHKLEFYWWRERDMTLLTYGVDDMYGLQYSMSQKLFNVYLYGFYKNDLTAGDYTPFAGSTYNDHPWWIGIGGGYRPGNWDLSGQFIYNGGKRENQGLIPDQDFAAWQGELLAKYRYGPGLVFAGELFYGTGNDANDSSKIKVFEPPVSNKWGNPVGVLWGFGQDRSVFYFMNPDLNYVSGRSLFYYGVWYARLNLEYNPVAWVNLMFNYMYIGDNASGTPGPGKVVNSPENSRQDANKDVVGQELNVIAKIKIYEALSYNIGLGYFWPGDVFDTPTRSADNGWALNTKLIYVF